jgi:hypothetical protein
LGRFLGDLSQDGVHKIPLPLGKGGGRHLHCLIDDREGGNPIEKPELIDRHAQDLPEQGIHLCQRISQEGGKESIQPSLPSQHPINYLGGQAFVKGIKTRPLQFAVEERGGKEALFLHPEKDVEGEVAAHPCSSFPVSI